MTNSIKLLPPSVRHGPGVEARCFRLAFDAVVYTLQLHDGSSKYPGHTSATSHGPLAAPFGALLLQLSLCGRLDGGTGPHRASCGYWGVITPRRRVGGQMG